MISFGSHSGNGGAGSDLPAGRGGGQSMIRKPNHVPIMVRDQDEALDWYTQKLGFRRVHDERNTIPGFRWLTIAPAGQESPEIVLLKGQDQTAVAGERCGFWRRMTAGRPTKRFRPMGSPSGRRPGMQPGGSRRRRGPLRESVQSPPAAGAVASCEIGTAWGCAPILDGDRHQLRLAMAVRPGQGKKRPQGRGEHDE